MRGKKFDEEIAGAFCQRAKAAKNGDNASLSMNAWSRLNGEKSTETEGTFDTGCTHPVTTTAVVEGLKMEIKHLREVKEIIQADGQSLKLLGSVRMFLESDKLNGRRMIDFVVIDGGKNRETLISIDYLKKWNLLHQTFPLETIDDYVERKINNNKYSALYSRLSNQLESSLYQESRGVKEPSNECKKLRRSLIERG